MRVAMALNAALAFSLLSICPPPAMAQHAPVSSICAPRDFYPSASRLNIEEGTVSVRVTVNADGSIAKVTVVKSSGFPLLDEATIERVKCMMFKKEAFQYENGMSFNWSLKQPQSRLQTFDVRAFAPHSTVPPHCRYLSTTPPVKIGSRSTSSGKYPVQAAMRGVGGIVLVDFIIQADGNVTDAVIAASSGYVVLDEATIAGVKDTQFTPASIDGNPVACRMQSSMVWEAARNRTPVAFEIVSELTVMAKADYPAESLSAGEQGVVVVSRQITKTGTPTKLVLIRSSGFTRLDDAALKLVGDRLVTTAPTQIAGEPQHTFVFADVVWALDQTGQ